MYIFFISLIFFHFSSQEDPQKYKIYIAKIDWHVGILLKIDENSIQRISALKEFDNYQFVDIGWGDAEFYQGPADFDLYLASKAILFPTPSVVRIQGYNRSVLSIADWRDYIFEINLCLDRFEKLCSFIDDSFQRDSDSNLILTSERYQGNVRFYSSRHKYHLLNTCNTWVAEALSKSGLDVDPGSVITADHLFEELLSVGILIKYDEGE
ncbi:MAG: DUF2459 domain-containing protein [Melioribacteraceae bacterium]|nr:DUF2459 domain-containing protein [Melioribacteraceae bacterium]